MSSLQRYVSDELSHFAGRSLPDDEARYDLLVRILKSGELRASAQGGASGFGTRQDVDFSSGNRYEPGMTLVCFCDIPEADLAIHTAKYSRFGMSFSKSFLLTAGASPVYYVDRSARYLNVGSRAEYFDSHIRELDWARDFTDQQGCEFVPQGTNGSGVNEWRDTNYQRLNYLLSFFEQATLLFVKWFDAELAEDDPENVYMEREWRTLEDVHFSTDDVTRIFLPREFARRLRSDLPDYYGAISFV